MKHKIKKWNSFRAGCERLGCMVSIEGGVVEKMSKKELGEFFKSECPATIEFDKDHNMLRYSGKEAIPLIVAHAKKEIKGWQKLIEYWNK